MRRCGWRRGVTGKPSLAPSPPFVTSREYRDGNDHNANSLHPLSPLVVLSHLAARGTLRVTNPLDIGKQRLFCPLRSTSFASPFTPFQVEDMLKRSFAEWRAQRSQPKALIQLEEVCGHMGGRGGTVLRFCAGGPTCALFTASPRHRSS